MNFQDVNQNLIRSFQYVKKDVLKLKESQKRQENELLEKHEEDLNKINQKILILKKELSNDSQISDLNKKVSQIFKDVKDVKSQALSRQELNSKMLAVYSQLKRDENTRSELKNLQKNFEKTNLQVNSLKNSTETLEKSRINVDEINKIFVHQKNFELNILSLKDKIREVQTLEISLNSHLQKTNEKIEELKKQTQKLVTQTEYTKSLNDFKRQSDLLAQNILRLNKESAQKSDVEKLNKENMSMAEKLKEKILIQQKEAKTLLPIKEFDDTLKIIKSNEEKLLSELRTQKEEKASKSELKDLIKNLSTIDQKSNERQELLKKELKNRILQKNHNDSVTELKRTDAEISQRVSYLSDRSAKKDDLNNVKNALIKHENKTKDYMDLKNLVFDSKEKIYKLNKELAYLHRELKIYKSAKKSKTKKNNKPKTPFGKVLSKIVYYFKEKPKKPIKKSDKTVITKTVKTNKPKKLVSAVNKPSNKSVNNTVITKTTTVKKVGR